MKSVLPRTGRGGTRSNYSACMECGADWTPVETVLPGKGDAAMEEWAIQGRASSSWWTKHRGGVMEEGVWLEELKQRQRAAVKRLQADRCEQKRERAEQAAAEAVAKRREHEARSAARMLASDDRKRQPVLPSG